MAGRERWLLWPVLVLSAALCALAVALNMRTSAAPLERLERHEWVGPERYHTEVLERRWVFAYGSVFRLVSTRANLPPREIMRDELAGRARIGTGPAEQKSSVVWRTLSPLALPPLPNLTFGFGSHGEHTVDRNPYFSVCHHRRQWAVPLWPVQLLSGWAALWAALRLRGVRPGSSVRRMLSPKPEHLRPWLAWLGISTGTSATLLILAAIAPKRSAEDFVLIAILFPPAMLWQLLLVKLTPSARPVPGWAMMMVLALAAAACGASVLESSDLSPLGIDRLGVMILVVWACILAGLGAVAGTIWSITQAIRSRRGTLRPPKGARGFEPVIK